MIDWSKVILAKTPEELEQEAQAAAREAFKIERELAVSRITVTTASGNVFDGDEVSQQRMSRAYIALQANEEGATTSWVLHDNTAVLVTKEELLEVLALAGQAQTDLWVA